MLLKRSELGAFRAIERAAARWAIARVKKVSRDWADPSAEFSYNVGWVVLAGSVLITGFGFMPLWGGAVLVGAAATLLVSLTARDQRLARRTAMKEQYPSDLHAVCAYITERIGAVEAERLGPKGEVTLLLQRVETMRAEAATLHRTIRQRTDGAAPNALLGAKELEDAAQTLAAFDEDLVELRRFSDALRAAFTAARAEIAGLTDPQSDFNVRRRLIELRAGAGQVHEEVRQLIAGSVGRIHGALEQIQTDLKALLVETGVQASLAIPLENDLRAGLDARREVIRTFVRRAHALDIPFRASKPTATTEGSVT
ncbi:MAG: hypothetical protein Q7R80_04900 [bacterium]|nr:hypothetical protein [bacterium]